MKMRLPFRALWAVLVLTGALASPASAQLGIAAGANFNELSDIQTENRQAAFESAQGWHVALWYDLAMGPLAIRPGIRYMDAGQLFADSDVNPSDGNVDLNYSVALVEIPIDARFRLGLPFLKPYVLGGPVLRFPAGEEGDEGIAEDFSMAAEIGAGVEVGFGGLRLYPELKYSFGISRFTKETYTIGGIEITPDDSQQLNVIMVSIGIGL